MPLRNDTAVATKFRWEDHRTIAHALGGLAGKDYLNSREGFLAMYEQGVRLFELDLSRTSDGVDVYKRQAQISIPILIKRRSVEKCSGIQTVRITAVI